MAISGNISTSQLDSTFGCLFIAVIFTSTLWGIGCLQLYLYYEKYWKSDRTWFKVYLFLIWVLDTVEQILISHDNYVYFVRGIGDQTLLAVVPKTSSFAILVLIVDAMVQVIFVRRVWYISNKNTIWTGFLFLAVLGQFAVGLAYCIEVSGFVKMAQLSGTVHLEIALNCTTVFTDAILAFTIMFLLWKRRSGIERSDSIMYRLIMYTVGTGLVTVLLALVALIGAIAASDSFVYILADFVIPKLYFNCVLASLNARSSLQGTSYEGAGGLSIHLGRLPSTSAGSSNVASDASNKVPTHRRVEFHSTIDIEGGGEKRQAWGDSSTAV